MDNAEFTVFAYPVRLHKDEDGRSWVECRDLPELATDGADETEALAEAGETKQALACIERTRSIELTALRSQLERVRNLLSKPPRRIVTVIRIGAEQVGLIVDEVASLAWVRTEDADISRGANALDQLFASRGRNEADARMVSMLEPRALRVHVA